MASPAKLCPNQSPTMSTDFFTQTAERRASAIAELDAQTFAPLIRNHLVQLFRKAHAKDKGLTGVVVGMGGCVPRGQYLSRGDETPDAHPDDREPRLYEASDWDADQYDMLQPKHPETLAFLDAVRLYDEALARFVVCDDITLDDLQTTRTRKAAIYGPHGLRARLNA